MALRLPVGGLLGALVLLVALSPACGRGEAEPSPSRPDAAPALSFPPLAPERMEMAGQVLVRREPDKGSPRRGLLIDCAVVQVVARQPGPGCTARWGQLAEGGWICLDHATPTTKALPTSHPLVAFDNPTTDELAAYRATGVFDRTTGPGAEALLPYVYGRRAGRFQGRCWADVASAQRGDAPVARLDPSRRVHFDGVIETEDGGYLTLPSGRVVPIDDVFLYAPSRFEGIDVTERPGPRGTSPAWLRAGGGRLRAEATIASEIRDDLPARTVVWVGEAETGADGRVWTPVHQADDVPTRGWVAASRLRVARLRSPPSDVGQALWIDVDLDQQTLMLVRDGALRYATLVSTGAREGSTPVGVYRLADKMLHWDMASREGSEDPYHLEEVPWVMHFWPRYALHAAFWHDGFGEGRSHGCINLSPRDAQEVFERTAPSVPPGWHTAWESPIDRGTTLRVRGVSTAVPDRRSAL